MSDTPTGDTPTRIALVTGASRGIGAAFAKALAAKGFHVVALARTVGALEELDDEIRKLGGTATLVPADLKDYEALDRLGAALYERYGHLDVLVGNAGVLGPLSPLSHVTPKRWDEVFAINVTANWRLIRSMEPLLRAAPAARALFVSSGAAYSTRAFWGPYSASKAALDAMVRSWANELAATPIRANLLDPGATRTRMRAEAMPGEDPMTLPTPEEVVEAALFTLAPEMAQTGKVYRYKIRRLCDVHEPS